MIVHSRLHVMHACMTTPTASVPWGLGRVSVKCGMRSCGSRPDQDAVVRCLVTLLNPSISCCTSRIAMTQREPWLFNPSSLCISSHRPCQNTHSVYSSNSRPRIVLDKPRQGWWIGVCTGPTRCCHRHCRRRWPRWGIDMVII